ncbi:MAG: metallophosphoesterase family protein [Anaerolineae bacterium]|jgi:predicted phosphodiesterase
MRVAALYDIHGNLPALEAVLDEVRRADVDAIVVGGDVVLGPMPHETLRCLLDLDRPTHFIHGNCELAVLAQRAAADESQVAYWGTTFGDPPPESIRRIFRWTAQQLRPDDVAAITGWPKTLRLEIDGLGTVLFCHSTPRSETEIFTRLTPEARLRPVLDGLGASVIVCGHTHMQFDRIVGDTRVVNAGSVGSPFGEPGAYWALLGPDVRFQRTSYDLAAAAERIRATPFPDAEAFAAESVLHPPTEADKLEEMGKAELR